MCGCTVSNSLSLEHSNCTFQDNMEFFLEFCLVLLFRLARTLCFPLELKRQNKKAPATNLLGQNAGEIT